VSGIAAIISFDGAPVETGFIEKMTSAMSYRGPDGLSHWIEGAVALGQCMMRTTQESVEEMQPLLNEDESVALVMDGVLDNWAELRTELLEHGAKLRTRADPELVLRAYEAWGKECLAHLDGDFAIIVWNRRRREAFCARDRMGNKPFHYHWDGRRLIVASDLCSILALPSVPRMTNKGILAELLAGEWLSRDETIWRGVMRLVAAHYMIVDGKGPRIDCYWSPPLDKTNCYKREEQYFEHYREIFADCVRRTSRSHRPVAYEVSGGLDSSAVFCMAEHLRKKSRLPALTIRGYTLAFVEEGDDNELSYVRAVRDHLGVPIHESAPTSHPLAWFGKRAVEEQNFPGFPNAAMFTDMRKAMTADGCRVVLNGEGGDEWLGGSRLYYAEDLARGEWCALRRSYCADVARFGLREPSYWFLRHGLSHQLPAQIKDAVRTLVRPSRSRLSNEGYWLSGEMLQILEQRRSAITQNDRDQRRGEGQRRLALRLNDAFGAYVKERCERSGAGFGLEIRAPMHRRAYVEWAFATPERMRLRGGINKYVHVRAMANLLPSAVANRIGKSDFAFMFRRHLDRMRKLLVETIPRQRRELVCATGMSRLYQAYSDRSLVGAPIWELWGVFGCCCLPQNEDGSGSFSMNEEDV
jgi:asparagine synthase (glutamine-hydrolysing)